MRPKNAHTHQIATAIGFPQCGKLGVNPRIKAVIARDTTYGVSLLTGTTHGSNFAIPRHEFSAPREWDGILKSSEAVRCPARGDSAPPAAGKGSGARAFQIRKPGARNLTSET